MKKWYRQIYGAIGVILTIGAFIALGGAVDSRYAKSVEVAPIYEEVAVVSDRLDRKILQDKIDYVQKQIWDLEDRWAERFLKEKGRSHTTHDELVAFMSEDARERLRMLEKQLDELREELRSRDNPDA